MNKLYFQAGTSLCSTPKTCCKWAAVGTRENTPLKILFRSHMLKKQIFTIYHPLFLVSLVIVWAKNLDTVQNGLNVIDLIKGCAGRNSLQWSTTSWHGARQGGANEDKVGWGWKKIWQVDLQGVGEDSQLYSIWLQGAEPGTLPGLTWSNSIGLEVIC